MEKYIPRGKHSSKPIRKLPEAAKALSQLFATPELTRLLNSLAGFSECYLVGGMVRDALLGEILKDIDLAVSKPPEEVQALLEKENFRVIETGIEHGTITVLAGDESVELTTFRKPSRRLETEYGSTIEEDLSGRDFTINAIAFDPTTQSFIDPFSGLEHLEKNKLLAVGNPLERFEEDPLRLLRMIRFGEASGRDVEPATGDAARVFAPSIREVSIERIRQELIGILLAPYPDAGIQALLNYELLHYVVPELSASVGFEQNEWHLHDVFDHTLWVLERSEPDALLRVACLLHDIGKPETLSEDEKGRHFYNHEHVGAEMAEEFLRRLKFSKQDTKDITALVKNHMRPLDCGPAGVRRVMRDLGDQFDRWLLLKRADAPPVMPEEEFEAMYTNFVQLVEKERSRLEGPAYGQLALSGSDLLELGFQEGPEVGRALSMCEEAVIEDPEKNNRDDLLKIVKECLRENPETKETAHDA